MAVENERVSLEHIKSAKIEDLFRFIENNSQVKELTQKMQPASVAIRAGKDFVEIKILMATPELATSIKDLK